MKQIHLSLHRDLNFGHGVQLRYGERHGERVYVALPAELHEVDPGAFIDPTMTLDDEAAQMLCDELHRLGFRPSKEERRAESSVEWMQVQLAKFIDMATRGEPRVIVSTLTDPTPPLKREPFVTSSF